MAYNLIRWFIKFAVWELNGNNSPGIFLTNIWGKFCVGFCLFYMKEFSEFFFWFNELDKYENRWHLWQWIIWDSDVLHGICLILDKCLVILNSEILDKLWQWSAFKDTRVYGDFNCQILNQERAFLKRRISWKASRRCLQSTF